jgi:probable blue pigment (indigoidine) exporter
MPATTSYRHALLVVSATACWGGGTVLSKQVLDLGVAPLMLLAIELAASTLLLGLGALVLGVRPTWSPALRRLALLGVLNPGFAYALGLLGLVTITASLSVLLWATEPVLIMLLAALLLRERIAAATMIGVAMALVGVLLVLYRPGASGNATGIGLTVGAVTACAFYTVLTRRLLLDDGSLDVVLVQQGAALCFATVLAGVVRAMGITNLGMPPDLTTWALAVASGMVYYGLAFWFFIGGLRGVPLGRRKPLPNDSCIRDRGWLPRRGPAERPAMDRRGDRSRRRWRSDGLSPHPNHSPLIGMTSRSSAAVNRTRADRRR